MITLALCVPGCAGVAKGLDRVQAGLAEADTATDKAARAFLESVTVVRAACEQSPDPGKCMADLGLGDDVLDAVCVPGAPGEPACVAGAAADLAQAYGEGAKAAAAASEAWGTLQPHLEAAEVAAKAVQSGLDS